MCMITYDQCLIEIGIKSFHFDSGLSFGVFASVREKDTLDIGIRQSIAVCSCQSSGTGDFHLEVIIPVLHTHINFPSDVIVSLHTAFIVEACFTSIQRFLGITQQAHIYWE